MKVRLGEWDASQQVEPYDYIEEQVADIRYHPQYNARNLKYDVAVLVLRKPVNYYNHPNINTVCLPNQGASFTGQR